MAKKTYKTYKEMFLDIPNLPDPVRESLMEWDGYKPKRSQIEKTVEAVIFYGGFPSSALTILNSLRY